MIGPRSADDKCLVIGYEATQRMRVSWGQRGAQQQQQQRPPPRSACGRAASGGGGKGQHTHAVHAMPLAARPGPHPTKPNQANPRCCHPQGNKLGTAFIEATERTGATAWHDLFDTSIFEIKHTGEGNTRDEKFSRPVTCT